LKKNIVLAVGGGINKKYYAPFTGYNFSSIEKRLIP